MEIIYNDRYRYKNARPAELVQKLDALQQTIFNIGAGMYRQATSDESMGGDMNNEMPGASFSGVGVADAGADKVSVGGVAIASELSPQAAPVGASQAPAPAPAQPAVPSPVQQVAQTQFVSPQVASGSVPASNVSAPPTEFVPAAAASLEEEFDIDCTVAADYEAIE